MFGNTINPVRHELQDTAADRQKIVLGNTGFSRLEGGL
jgi:hypothetical protein